MCDHNGGKLPSTPGEFFRILIALRIPFTDIPRERFADYHHKAAPFYRRGVLYIPTPCTETELVAWLEHETYHALHNHDDRPPIYYPAGEYNAHDLAASAQCFRYRTSVRLSHLDSCP